MEKPRCCLRPVLGVVNRLHMKTQINLLLRALTVMALFSATDLASAYYDPGVQRWINRDPIAEMGFRKLERKVVHHILDGQLYGFVRNRPPTAGDPWGLTIWKCTRTSHWGVGRHAYLWDDRAGPLAQRSCGQGASGRTGQPDDRGPVESDPSWWFDLLNLDYVCVPIAATEGQENTIMEHCRSCINKGWGRINIPGIYDCHNRCDKMLRDLGYPAPPLDKANPGDFGTYPLPITVPD
jgi:hypothetical protein